MITDLKKFISDINIHTEFYIKVKLKEFYCFSKFLSSNGIYFYNSHEYNLNDDNISNYIKIINNMVYCRINPKYNNKLGIHAIFTIYDDSEKTFETISLRELKIKKLL